MKLLPLLALFATFCSACSTVASAPVPTPIDPNSAIGQIDQFGVTVTTDKPSHPACNRKFVSVKLDTFESCLVPGLTYVQVANILGYKGTLSAQASTVEIWQWNDGQDRLLTAKFEGGRLVSKSQLGLEPYQP
jgi:hypothetical protein